MAAARDKGLLLFVTGLWVPREHLQAALSYASCIASLLLACFMKTCFTDKPYSSSQVEEDPGKEKSIERKI